MALPPAGQGHQGAHSALCWYQARLFFRAEDCDTFEAPVSFFYTPYASLSNPTFTFTFQFVRQNLLTARSISMRGEGLECNPILFVL